MKITLFGYVVSISKQKKYEMTYQRRSGQTTRRVDEMIQELFTTGKCRVRDHYGGGLTNRRRVFEIATKRLAREHGITEKNLLRAWNYETIELKPDNQ